MTEESLEMIDIARTFLIDREFRLINARKIALEALKSNASSGTNSSNLQSYDPFKRQDGKRKSIGNPIMNIFRRPSSVPTSQAAAYNQGKTKNMFGLGKKVIKTSLEKLHLWALIIILRTEILKFL